MAANGQKKVMVINCGSSSLKYEVFQMPEQAEPRQGTSSSASARPRDSLAQNSPARRDQARAKSSPTTRTPWLRVGQALVDPETGILPSIDEIDGVGHRVVHGGERFADSVVIDDDGDGRPSRSNIELAPLHNPANLTGIQRGRGACCPASPQVGGLRHRLPPDHAARRLPLRPAAGALRQVPHPPLRLPRHQPPLRGRRAPRAAEAACPRTPTSSPATSATAPRSRPSSTAGRSTPPWASPPRGPDDGHAQRRHRSRHPRLPRGARLQRQGPDQLDAQQEERPARASRASRTTCATSRPRPTQGTTRAPIEALDVYAYRVRKYIGAYVGRTRASVDALVFTGGIGQHGVEMRERICHRLENIGIVHGLRGATRDARLGRRRRVAALLAHRHPRRPDQRGIADSDGHLRAAVHRSLQGNYFVIPGA
ncbi:MAG: hypothetical protein MZU95_10320 [Desulfomicrobium escambiense]|nr:hypothetical protein [Desulfomicrobium escambiense]